MNAPFDQFNFRTTRWQAGNALGLAAAAKLAYETPQAIDAGVKAWGFNRSTYLATPAGVEWDTQLYVASNAEMVLVSFRGTQPDQLKDWITDCDCILAKSPVGGVHFGFWAALESIWDNLAQAVVDHQDRGQSLWFTGHSLGAALATLAVARYRLELKPIYSLYTYGSPRAGDPDFGEKFDEDFGEFSFRYVNNSDAVTRVPTREMGYSHIGNTLMFDAEGQIHSDMHFWNRLLENMKGDLHEFLQGRLAFFEDHRIEHYLTNAEKNADKNPF
jgi:triacylglycerol lipase